MSRDALQFITVSEHGDTRYKLELLTAEVSREFWSTRNQ
jgi:hypothetical protein